jgi:hypothetical protein
MLLSGIKNDKGDVALIVLPIFILFVVTVGMAVAEFSNYLITRQRISYLSREASYLSLTKCWDKIFQEASVAQVQGAPISSQRTDFCLDSDAVKKYLLDSGQELVKDFNSKGDIRIHIWVKNTLGEGSWFTSKKFSRSSSELSNNPPTRFANNSLINPNLQEIQLNAKSFHRIAIAEVYYNYTHKILPNALKKFLMPAIYEVSIF